MPANTGLISLPLAYLNFQASQDMYSGRVCESGLLPTYGERQVRIAAYRFVRGFVREVKLYNDGYVWLHMMREIWNEIGGKLFHKPTKVFGGIMLMMMGAMR
jgi:hypothetical protein